MDVNIANRLCELRKKNNYSQEELADKLGLSRQAVSKWERAEASPDTDNLIMLAKLYNVTLDELLFGKEEAMPDNGAVHQKSDTSDKNSNENSAQRNGDYVNIGKDGVHVISKDGDEVHINCKGVHIVNDKNDEEDRDVSLNVKHNLWIALPFPFIIAVVYVVLGVIYNLWHPAWLLFLLISVYYDFVKMFTSKSLYKKLHHFPVAMLSTLTYLCLGFFADLWHPSWLVFLIIPLYYTIIDNVCPKHTVQINDSTYVTDDETVQFEADNDKNDD